MHPLSHVLAQARRDRRSAALAPSHHPASAAEAYAIQAETAALLGTSPAGWKVGFSDDRQPLAAPIFACDVTPDRGTYRLAPGETVKLEVEIAVRLARDLPPGRTYGVADVLAACGEILIGLELVGTRFADPDSAPFEARLADAFNNAGFVAGEGRGAGAPFDRLGPPLRLWIDGALAADHPARHPEGDPLTPLAAWASAQADRLGGLRAGQIVTTGSLNTPVPLARPARVEAELEGLGRVTLSLT